MDWSWKTDWIHSEIPEYNQTTGTTWYNFWAGKAGRRGIRKGKSSNRIRRRGLPTGDWGSNKSFRYKR